MLDFDSHILDDVQVQTLARPGESWDQARDRLSRGVEKNARGQSTRSRRICSAQMELLWQWHLSLQGLSSRERFEQALEHKGLRWPSEVELRAHPDFRHLITDGQNWSASTQRLPHEDVAGLLHYLVVTPYCEGWLLCCRFIGGRWATADNGFIGDVTHWRLAAVGERSSREATSDEMDALRSVLLG